MTGRELLRDLMEKERVSNVELAEKLGVTSATMWARLNYDGAKDVTLSVFSETLNALGYEMVVRKKKEVEETNEMVVKIDGPKPDGRGRPKKAKTPDC